MLALLRPYVFKSRYWLLVRIFPPHLAECPSLFPPFSMPKANPTGQTLVSLGFDLQFRHPSKRFPPVYFLGRCLYSRDDHPEDHPNTSHNSQIFFPQSPFSGCSPLLKTQQPPICFSFLKAIKLLIKVALCFLASVHRSFFPLW